MNMSRSSAKQDLYHIPYVKITSQWIQDLNIGLHIINLLEGNIRETLQDIVTGKDSLTMSPRDTGIKSKRRQIRLHQAASVAQKRD